MLRQLQSFPASVSVEVLLTETINGAKINFPDVPELRNNPAIGFACYSVADVGIAPSGRTLVDAQVVADAYITILNTNNFAFISSLPYGFFETIRLSGTLRSFEKPTYLNLQQSYIELFGSDDDAGTVALFDFFYIPQK